MSSCVFCDIANGTSGAALVYSSPYSLAFAPLEPTSVGHTLVIPREHAEVYWDLSSFSAAELGKAVVTVAQAVVRATKCPGLTITNSNGVVATQTIRHVHFHLIPRWPDDGLGPIWFKSKNAEAQKLVIAERIRVEIEAMIA